MKRKREDDDATETITVDLSVKQKRIQLKLKTEVAKVRHAFKVAKGFERQKLAKRRKDAAQGKGEKGIDRIDAEIEALKTLDIDLCAQHHFHKTLCKIKAVMDHPDLPPEAKELARLPSDTVVLDLNARLCNSKPVRHAHDAGISVIQQAMGIKPDDSKTAKKKRQRAKDFDDEQPAARKTGATSVARSDSDGRGPMDRQGDRDWSGEESEGDEDFQEFDDRIAASSDEDVDVDALEQRLADEGLQAKSSKKPSKSYDIRADLSLSDADSDSESVDSEPQKIPAVKGTAFIPTLTMGGYISGSGSDIEEAKFAPKKNRRGQRARQQIWEQKYGEKAKHMQNPDRNTGWDPKKGAVASRGERGARRAKPDDAVSGSRIAGDGGRLQALKQAELDAKPLHPSWEAAKKAKERKDAPVAFQGKKITFD